MLELSDHDGLKNPEEMNPSSQNLIPSKEGQDRKCHCHNVSSCVWEKGWRRQLEEKLNTFNRSSVSNCLILSTLSNYFISARNLAFPVSFRVCCFLGVPKKKMRFHKTEQI